MYKDMDRTHVAQDRGQCAGFCEDHNERWGSGKAVPAERLLTSQSSVALSYTVVSHQR
jgi:hypothetical protein